MSSIFTTKAQTINKLGLKKIIFKLPNSIFFSVKEWKINKNQILKEIKKKLNNKIAIRSSAIDEDTSDKSSAGAYDSFLNISNNKQSIDKYVNLVIKSYKKKNNYSLHNEVLIQSMVTNVWTSGVLFTKNITNNSPYYIINYDDISGKTDKVTSGVDQYSNKVLKILRDKEKLLLSPRFNKLIKATKEIESIFNNKNLDIEFVIDKNLNIFLLQVRPLTKIKKFLNQKKFYSKINQVNNKINKNTHDKKKIKNIFGQMPDWNPAEMIGKHPKNLSFSLYSELITDKSWYLARKFMGYSKIKETKLMINLAGQPFIDVKKSLLSLLPENLSKKLKDILLYKSLNILKNNPELHDKIEFECSVNCQTLDTKKQIDKIYKDLSKSHKKELFLKLSELTKKNLDLSKKSLFIQSIYKVQELDKNQNKFLKYKFLDLRKIITATKKFGIIPFSILARHAFISQSILRSLVEKKIFTQRETQKILSSVETVTTDLIHDSLKLSQGIIKISAFKKKYGHLRPGTYNIDSQNYESMNIKNFIKTNKQSNLLPINKIKISKEKLIRFHKLAKEENFPFIKLDSLISYIKDSIYWREYSKFIFTKSINQIFKIIKKFGKNNGINTKDLAYIEIKNFLKIRKSIMNKPEKINLNKKIFQNKNQYQIENQIELPLLIKSKTDAFIIPSQISRANFITNKKIIGKSFFLSNNHGKFNNKELKNKIILIEGADPGYDWIFLHGIKGLVTKYGGANSHMSIRCYELGVPAAIGCGNEKFNILKESNLIEIDTISKSIKGSL